MVSERFSIDSMVLGYNVYKNVREADVGKEQRVLVAEIADNGTSLASAPSGSSSPPPQKKNIIMHYCACPAHS